MSALFPEWHKIYLCIPAHVSPGGIVDESRPIPGMWMCGLSSGKDFRRCKGFVSIVGEGLGPYGKYGESCASRGGLGECLLAGRVATHEELYGETHKGGKRSMADSHALMAEEIVRLRKLIQRLREALTLTKLAKSNSQENFDAFVDHKLEGLKED
jgi:hypothetical protein